MQNRYCAAGLENLAADEELKEGERAEPSRSWGWENQIARLLKEGVVPDLLALVSAFCAAGQPKIQNGYCAAGPENWVPCPHVREVKR
jgi:hypothetical protein